ncbi:MAG: tryptophan synthase subunit alpha [Planctomycetota bacterium]
MGATNRIDAIFEKLRADGRKALMPFVCAGYPSIEATTEVLPALGEAGGSIIEIGFPFSDPIADGPTIAAAMHEALQRGLTTEHIFRSVRSIRDSTDAGLVAMVSVSIVQRMGAAAFATQAADAGFDGVIIPDVPVDEAESVLPAFRDANLTTSLLVSPTTPPDRAARIAGACTGFVYVLARVGITGEGGGGAVPTEGPSLQQRVAALRAVTDLPLACGFGIASADDVASVVGAGGADAAIVGSAIVKRMGSGPDAAAVASGFVRELAAGLPH